MPAAGKLRDEALGQEAHGRVDFGVEGLLDLGLDDDAFVLAAGLGRDARAIGTVPPCEMCRAILVYVLGGGGELDREALVQGMTDVAGGGVAEEGFAIVGAEVVLVESSADDSFGAAVPLLGGEFQISEPRYTESFRPRFRAQYGAGPEGKRVARVGDRFPQHQFHSLSHHLGVRHERNMGMVLGDGIVDTIGRPAGLERAGVRLASDIFAQVVVSDELGLQGEQVVAVVEEDVDKLERKSVRTRVRGPWLSFRNWKAYLFHRPGAIHVVGILEQDVVDQRLGVVSWVPVVLAGDGVVDEGVEPPGQLRKKDQRSDDNEERMICEKREKRHKSKSVDLCHCG